MRLPLPCKQSSIAALIAVLLTLWCASIVPAEDLLGAYEQASATSPVLAKARALLQANEASRPLARSGLLPKSNINAGVSGNKADITGFGADLGGPSTKIDKNYYGANYSITLTQPILNGQAWVALRAADAQVRAGQAAVLAAEQQLILQVSQAYFRVLRAQADDRVAVSQRDLLRTILDQEEAALRVGSGDVIAVSEARARLDGAESDRIVAENALQIARQGLERLTHRPVETLDDLGPVQPEKPSPDRIDDWVEMAGKNQPLITQAREQLQAARDQVEFASRSRWPSLNANAGYGYVKGTLLPSVENEYAQIGLNVSIPLYEGGEISARVRQARAQAQATRYGLDDLQDQVNLDTKSAFLNLKDSAAQLSATTRGVESAKTSLDATRKGYEIGSRSIVDLLNSTQDYANARRLYYLSLYNHMLARVQLKTAAGVVSVRDVEAINSMLKPGG
jgi:outer membrane protein